MSPRRGDVILVQSRKDQPHQAVGRPALVGQSDRNDAEAYYSMVVCLITG